MVGDHRRPADAVRIAAVVVSDAVRCRVGSPSELPKAEEGHRYDEPMNALECSMFGEASSAGPTPP
jgi:hypothetical protein